MNTLQKIVTIIAEIFGSILGQTDVDTGDGKAPLWSVIGMAILGIISITLIIIGAVFYFIK